MGPTESTVVPEEPVEVGTKAAPQQISRKQLGELRKRYFTVEHSTVIKCEHKIDTRRAPKNNCPSCWEAYFKVGVDMVEVHNLLSEKGPKALESKYGTKFVKAFSNFMAQELTPQAEEVAQ